MTESFAPELVPLPPPLPPPLTLTTPLRLDTKFAELPPPEPRREYWAGTATGSPIQSVSVGRIDFMRFSGTPTFGTTGHPDRPLTLGVRQWRTDAEVAEVLRLLPKRVVRTALGGRREVLSTDGRYFRPARGDEPLAKYLWLHAIDPATPTPTEEPEMLVS